MIVAPNPTTVTAAELGPDRLLALYRRMLLSRAVDVRAWTLSRQGRAHFVITSRGHEAAEIGSAFALQPGRDWILPYYRSLALVLGVGMTAERRDAEHLCASRRPEQRWSAAGDALQPS